MLHGSSGLAIAGHDASFNLQGNYTNAAGNVLKANRDLTFTATGGFINQTALEAVGKLTLNVANIDNQVGAGINSDWTVLNTTGNVTNAGRIEGNTVETHSNNFTNTATVMGDSINLYANNLDNLNANALIAATRDVNLIIANALNNQNGATLYSLGDINIGANLTLDANGYLTGNAASVSNRSATIDATGNLRISAHTITNKRTMVGVEWGTTRAGAYVPGNPRYTPYVADQQFTAATTAASQVLSGAGIWIRGGSLTNDYSTIIAGGTLTSQLTTLTNSGAPFQRSETRVGQQDIVQWLPTGATRCNAIGMNCSPVWGWVTVTTPYAPAPIYTNVPRSVNATYLQGAQPGGTPHTVNIRAVTAGSVANVAPINPGALPELTVTSGGLYTIHTQPGQKYLVVTDPRFASYQNFVSSDYMLGRLVLDSQQIQKRLGDGFYEQKLVTDQITAQTGRRYLGGYTDAQSQFIALLDAGVSAAKDIQLVPGIGLTSKQIDALTQDIVWMVEREVTLPDGRTERVLAPQVFLTRLHGGDLKSGGALIAANDIRVNASDSIANSGSIQGGASNVLAAKNISNSRGAIGSRGFTLLNADYDILNLSGQINGSTVGLAAGRDIRVEHTSRDITRTVNLGGQAGTGAVLAQPRRVSAPLTGVVSSTELDLESGISSTDNLSLNAGRDLSLSAANINSGGDTILSAGRDLNAGVLTATETSNTPRYNASRSIVTQLGSNIQAGGNLDISAGNDMRLTATTLDAGNNANLIAGGNLTLDAAKNSSAFSFDTGVVQQRSYDEAVLGTKLNAGGNITLAATDGKGQGGRDNGGNIALESAAISSKNGSSTSSGQSKLTIVADASVNVGNVEEKHESFQQMRLESSGWFSSTTNTIRDENSRTAASGSNLDSDRITIQSGRDINVTGSNVSASKDITLAAMTDINILAATETYKQNHSREEVSNGLITGGTFGFTVGQDKSTTQTNADGATQSQSRSTLNSTSGNLNLLSGGNAIIAGSDLSATQGTLTATAGGSIAVFAGLDSLSQYTESHHDQDTGLFSKQKRTITDTLIQSQFAGSSLAANTLDLQAGENLILQAAKLNSTGDTTIAAAGDIQLLSITDSSYTNHTEKLQTEGVDLFNPVVALADRRRNNQITSRNQTAKITAIQSGGNLSSSSGGNTLIEASQLNVNGSVDLNAGYDVNGQPTKPDACPEPCLRATITFAAVKDSDYLNIEDQRSSLAWQSQSGKGHNTETIRLANISAGKGLSVNATGGVVVDIPDVPAPVESTPPVDPNSADSTSSEQGTGANNAVSNTISSDTRTPQQRLDDHLITLAQQPGQAWIGQLANDPRTKVQWQQTNAAVEQWEYSHEGLTPEAVGVIAIVVAYASAGAASEAAAGIVSSASATSGVALSATASAAATSAVTAGLITLASQASVSLANNKGDIGKTLDDMGKSENVKSVMAAMLTAGVGTTMPSTNMTGVLTQTATGCVTGEMTGIGCEMGTTNAAVTSGAALAYYTMVGYAADLRPGENRNGTKTDGTSTGNGTYEYDESTGRQLTADIGINVIGLNRPDSILSQGGAISKALNQVPFVNAAGGWHDYIFNSSPILNDWFTVVNVPAMIPAAMLAMPASLNDPSVSWFFINGLPYTLNTPPKPPVIPSIISLPNTALRPVLSVNNQGRKP